MPKIFTWSAPPFLQSANRTRAAVRMWRGPAASNNGGISCLRVDFHKWECRPNPFLGAPRHPFMELPEFRPGARPWPDLVAPCAPCRSPEPEPSAAHRHPWLLGLAKRLLSHARPGRGLCPDPATGARAHIRVVPWPASPPPPRRVHLQLGPGSPPALPLANVARCPGRPVSRDSAELADQDQVKQPERPSDCQ